jgi:AhpD family alkylhydroperoxidase
MTKNKNKENSMKNITSPTRAALHHIESLDPENPSLDEIAFEPFLLDLIRLRVAMIFNCQLCGGTHAASLRAAGEADGRIRDLDLWSESALYDKREKSAFALADFLATQPTGPVPPEIVREARAHFNDAEILQLVLTIFAASDWNYESGRSDSRGMIIAGKNRASRSHDPNLTFDSV